LLTVYAQNYYLTKLAVQFLPTKLEIINKLARHFLAEKGVIASTRVVYEIFIAGE